MMTHDDYSAAHSAADLMALEGLDTEAQALREALEVAE